MFVYSILWGCVIFSTVHHLSVYYPITKEVRQRCSLGYEVLLGNTLWAHFGNKLGLSLLEGNKHVLWVLRAGLGIRCWICLLDASLNVDALGKLGGVLEGEKNWKKDGAVPLRCERCCLFTGGRNGAPTGFAGTGFGLKSKQGRVETRNVTRRHTTQSVDWGESECSRPEHQGILAATRHKSQR